MAGAYGLSNDGITFAATELTAHAITKERITPFKMKNNAANTRLAGLSLDKAMKHPAIADNTTIITSAPTAPNAPTSKAARPTCIPATAVVVTGSAICIPIMSM